MEVNLSVPYKSQHGEDSKSSSSDCGPASEAMVLEFFGRPTTTGQVLQKLGNPKGFVGWDQLKKVAKDAGFNVILNSNASFDDIKNFLSQGVPVIVVGGYGYLNSTQEKADNGQNAFKGSHIMVVVGVRSDDSVYCNDPDFWGDKVSQGDHHVYTKEEFLSFWQNAGNAEGNLPNTLFVIVPKQADISPTALQPQAETPQATGNPRVLVTDPKGVRVRTEPSTNGGDKANIKKVIKVGNEIEIKSQVAGETVAGVSLWFGTDEGYIWSGAVKVVVPLSTDKVEQVQTNSNPSLTPDQVQVQTESQLRAENDQLRSENEALKNALKRFLDVASESSNIAKDLSTQPVSEDTKKSLNGYWDGLKNIFSFFSQPKS